ncbi:MAG: type I-E CRISPR-associated protein Cse2/CasB [Anaerolineales bacterium]
MARPHSDVFIAYLQRFAENTGDEETPKIDRAALATLRRSLSGQPRDVVRTFRYIGQLLPRQREAQDLYVLIAGLFAMHPMNTAEGNLGDHLAMLRDAVKAEGHNGRADTIDKRLAAMLQVRRPHLRPHLLRMITFLKAGQVPVNWALLLRQLGNWDDPSGWVQRSWATSFWGSQNADSARRSSSMSQQQEVSE